MKRNAIGLKQATGNNNCNSVKLVQCIGKSDKTNKD